MKEISLYIHIPFCKQRCFYCDFPTFAGKERFRKDYIDALVKEIEERCSNYLIKSIFIGGGTPSYLEENELKKLLGTVSKLNLLEGLEYSMECNPGTLNEEKLKIMKNYGVNRISFGLQSCDNKLLKKIGRIHTFEEFLENYNLARKIGFNNINIDLMYGLPNLTIENWKDTLEKICYLKPEHISAYSLIIEEGTAFYKLYEKDKLELPTEDDERIMDKLTKDILKANGYHQYEISNYSKEGYECKHNIVYWKCDNYLGLGPGASGYINNYRYSNICDIKGYNKCLEYDKRPIEEKNILSKKDEMEEFIFMGLRMNKGINLDEFYKRFNIDFKHRYNDILGKLKNLNLIIEQNNNIILTQRGREISNTVFVEFID